MSVFPPSLWEFSLSVYAQPGMERLCLWLQDSRQVNVNTLLWALWLDEQQYPFHADLWRRGLSCAAPWQLGVVVPLRSLRRRLPKRPPWLSLRTRVQQWELRGERRQLQCLQVVSDGFNVTRDVGGKETAGSGNQAGRPSPDAGYVWRLVGTEEQIYGELKKIMHRWRQQRVERVR